MLSILAWVLDSEEELKPFLCSARIIGIADKLHDMGM